jgi:DNA-directed RNA polymerase subunit H
MVDVSQHNLVPEHSVLDDDGVETVLEDYDVDRTDLPKITRRDPALPDDAEVGDVIEIRRDSRTAGNALVYRLVVDS